MSYTFSGASAAALTCRSSCSFLLTLVLVFACCQLSSQALATSSRSTTDSGGSRNSSNDVNSMVALLDWAVAQGVHLPRWSKATDPCGAARCCSLRLSNQLDSVPCNWGGICCDSWNVTVLDMSCGKEVCDAQLKGSMPADALGQLHRLSYLNMSGHMLESGLELMHWSTLTHLHTLDLSWNHFTSVLPWAGSFQQLPLEGLYLQNNQFEGPLPSAWEELVSLQTLQLSNNQLFGTIPPEWAMLNALRLLDLSSNCGLCGFVPSLGTNVVLLRQGTALGYTCSSALCVSRDWKPLIIGIGISTACAVALSFIYALRVRFLRSSPLYGTLLEPHMERASRRSASMLDALDSAGPIQPARRKPHMHDIVMLRLTVYTDTCMAHLEQVHDTRTKRRHHRRQQRHTRSQHALLHRGAGTSQPLPFNAFANAWAHSVGHQLPLQQHATAVPHASSTESSHHSVATSYQQGSINAGVDVEAGWRSARSSDAGAVHGLQREPPVMYEVLPPEIIAAARQAMRNIALGQPVHEQTVVEGTVLIQLDQPNAQLQRQPLNHEQGRATGVDTTHPFAVDAHTRHAHYRQLHAQQQAQAAMLATQPPPPQLQQEPATVGGRLFRRPFEFLHRVLQRPLQGAGSSTWGTALQRGPERAATDSEQATGQQPQPQPQQQQEEQRHIPHVGTGTAQQHGSHSPPQQHSTGSMRVQMTEMSSSIATYPTATTTTAHVAYTADIQLDVGGTLPCWLPGVDLIVLSPDLQVVDFAVRDDVANGCHNQPRDESHATGVDDATAGGAEVDSEGLQQATPS